MLKQTKGGFNLVSGDSTFLTGLANFSDNMTRFISGGTSSAAIMQTGYSPILHERYHPELFAAGKLLGAILRNLPYAGPVLTFLQDPVKGAFDMFFNGVSAFDDVNGLVGSIKKAVEASDKFTPGMKNIINSALDQATDEMINEAVDTWYQNNSKDDKNNIAQEFGQKLVKGASDSIEDQIFQNQKDNHPYASEQIDQSKKEYKETKSNVTKAVDATKKVGEGMSTAANTDTSAPKQSTSGASSAQTKSAADLEREKQEREIQAIQERNEKNEGN